MEYPRTNMYNLWLDELLSVFVKKSTSRVLQGFGSDNKFITFSEVKWLCEVKPSYSLEIKSDQLLSHSDDDTARLFSYNISSLLAISSTLYIFDCILHQSGGQFIDLLVIPQST